MNEDNKDNRIGDEELDNVTGGYMVTYGTTGAGMLRKERCVKCGRMATVQIRQSLPEGKCGTCRQLEMIQASRGGK